jgi:hypothetical protein
LARERALWEMESLPGNAIDRDQGTQRAMGKEQTGST